MKKVKMLRTVHLPEGQRDMDGVYELSDEQADRLIVEGVAQLSVETAPAVKKGKEKPEKRKKK